MFHPGFQRLTLRIAIVVAACFATVAAWPQSPTNSATTVPPRSWVDPATGHRVIRITQEPDSASFYFNVNSYTPDGKEMIYTTPSGISAIDLSTWKSRSVVQGKVHTIQAGRKTPSIYYVKPEERALYVTNVDSGETRKLATLPPRSSVGTINADETLAAGTYTEEEDATNKGSYARSPQVQPLVQPRNKEEMMEQRLAARIPSVLFTLDLRSGKSTTLLHSTDWLGHLLFSPSDPNLLMYCHEGPWHEVDRIWTIHSDGTQNTLIHKRTMFMEIAGHEFWSPDGKTVWYDWQFPRGEDFWLAGYDLDTGKRAAYHLQRDEWSIHFNVSADGSLFCGDGGDPGQVARAPDGEWIYLFHPEKKEGEGIASSGFIQPGVFHAERLVNMSKHNYHLEPNVSFTPDKKWVIFRSNMFGPTYVFAVEVNKGTDIPGGS